MSSNLAVTDLATLVAALLHLYVTLVEGGGRFTENFLGLLTHIEEQGSLQLDPPAPWLVKICTDLHSCSADWCALVRYPFGKACIKAQ